MDKKKSVKIEQPEVDNKSNSSFLDTSIKDIIEPTTYRPINRVPSTIKANKVYESIHIQKFRN